MSMPIQAPQICTKMYVKPFKKEMWPVIIVARVTAGFKWPPDTLAVMYTALQPCSLVFQQVRA